MTSPKVFGIGMHKTGTSSLATALYSLGYSVRGFDVGIDVDELGNLDPATGRERVWNACLDVVAEADAFQDTPWWLFYRELDEAFPVRVTRSFADKSTLSDAGARAGGPWRSGPPECRSPGQVRPTHPTPTCRAPNRRADLRLRLAVRRLQPN